MFSLIDFLKDTFGREPYLKLFSGNKFEVMFDNSNYTLRVNGIEAEDFDNDAGIRPKFIFTDLDGTKYIIKLGNQSRTEQKVLSKIKEEDLRYFPRVVATGKSGGYHFIMQEFLEFRELKPNEVSAIWSVLQPIVEKYDISDIGELSNWNWSVTKDGKPIIYDFGINHSIN